MTMTLTIPRRVAAAISGAALTVITGAVAPAAAAPSLPAAGIQPVTAAQRALAFTTTSERTRDMRGVEPSLYRGKYYRAGVESKRRCIVRRESEGRYDVVSRNGYHGAYQVSRSLARGATWMMLREHRALLGDQAAEKVMAQLRAKPMSRWPRYWQDAAFHTVYNWERTGSGARHWAGGRWRC